MSAHKPKVVRLEELKKNLKIHVFGIQEYVKQYGTAHFEDESTFKKYRRGFDEMIHSSLVLNTGLYTQEVDGVGDIKGTCLDHIYSRGRIAEFILNEALCPVDETLLDDIIDRDAYLWVSVARVTDEQNIDLRNSIKGMDLQDIYKMKHYKECDLVLRYKDVFVINNKGVKQGYSELTNHVGKFPEIIYECEISSVVENMADVPWFEMFSKPVK